MNFYFYFYSNSDRNVSTNTQANEIELKRKCKYGNIRIKRVQVCLHAQVLTIRTYNGMEFMNQNLQGFFDSVGITHQKSAAYSAKQNDVVERQNRTLVEVARTMLTSANLPLHLWAEAVATACFHPKSIYHKQEI